MQKRHWKMIYEGVMLVLVIISLAAMMSNENSNFRYIHQIIWLIFLVDVIIRFVRTSVKWRYIKDNPFDIVTVIPLEDTMLLARFARFVRLFRYKNLAKRYVNGVSESLKEIGFTRLTLGVIGLNIAVSFLLILFTNQSIVESTIWVWGNFLKFNYETTVEGLVFLSVIIKILGLIYYGLLIQEMMAVGRDWYEKFRNKEKEKPSLKGENVGSKDVTN